MTTPLAPCEWVPYGCSPCTGLVAPEIEQQWLDFSVGALWRATGRMYGACPIKVRPCRSECGDYWGGLPYPVRLDGQWVNLCSSCPGDCSCTSLEEVLLPGPVSEIVELKLDGVVLAPASGYVRVDDWNRVVRVDGGRWPTCQNLAAPDTEVSTWSITYKKGYPIPAGGSAAAQVLACEFIKACAGDGSCRLPQRVQAITRQGVTVAFQDTFDMLSKNGFGLFEVDAWIANVNSGYPPPRASTPDLPRQRVQTWPSSP